MSSSATTTATQAWTVIPVGRETDSEYFHHYDETGVFVLEGAMTPAQQDELVGYLEEGKRYRPALLNILGVALKRFDARWYEMSPQRATILTDEEPSEFLRRSWPVYSLEASLNETVSVTIPAFLAACEQAASRDWQMPRIVRIEISEDADGGWSGAAAALANLADTGIESIVGDPLSATPSSLGHAWLAEPELGACDLPGCRS